jgi:hypothetical protein
LPVTTEAPARQILEQHFPKLQGKLPIRGGWGYSKEDAVTIDRDDACVEPKMPFDGVGLEYLFVEKRIYEELIIFRRPGEKFAGIEWQLIRQSLVPSGDRTYDCLEFEVTAFHERDWNELKAEWEGPDGYLSPGFDKKAHVKKRAERQLTLRREFWFDITSFFGG